MSSRERWRLQEKRMAHKRTKVVKLWEEVGTTARPRDWTQEEGEEEERGK